jgi:glycerol-3-phosphate acyltransferase PlsY
LAAVIGHNHSVFLGFRGGAGSMTNAGVVLATVPYVVPFMAVAGVIGALLSRIAAVASIAAAATMVVVLLASFCLRYTSLAYVIYGLLACALIVYELRPNIQRLRSGTERRVEHY